MKTSLCRFFSFLVAAFIFQFAGHAADTNPPPRLTVDLRDGSRVVGTSVEENFKFHSALLGEIKLVVKDVRALECVSTNTARLTTVKGDTLMVSFVDSEIAVKTGFGKVELPVDSIRKFTVSPNGEMGAHLPGLVALWSGEGDGHDSAGSHDAELMNLTFAEGKVGQAFSLNASGSMAKIPATSTLDVGKGDGLTIAAWIKPGNINGLHPILEWNDMSGVAVNQGVGTQMWLGHTPSSYGVLFGATADANTGQQHFLESLPGTIINNSFQYVAFVYDKASGQARLYVNGVVVARAQWGSFAPLTTGNIWFSHRSLDHHGDWSYGTFLDGLLDEISIYNRALSAEEIKSICIEDNHGEMPPPPPVNSPMPPDGIYRQGFSR
jgi:hypothetical protein